MKDGFDYNVPESPRDCCAGMSRHGRLMRHAMADAPLRTDTPRRQAEPAPSEPVTAPRE